MISQSMKKCTTGATRLRGSAQRVELHLRADAAVSGQREWFAQLRKRKILVRWFDSPATRDYLRITIGTDAEARTVVRAAKDILR